MRDHVSARRALRVRAVLRAARGRVRATLEQRSGRAAPPDPGRTALAVALRRLPARAGAAARHPARGLDAAAAGRPARRAPRPRRGLGQERRRQPDPLVQGPGRVGRARSRARARLPDDRVRVDRQPGQRGGRPRRGRRSRVLRVHPVRPRGAEGAGHRRLRHQPRLGPRQLRRRQPALHRALGGARLGVREHQHAAVLRRGVEDARVRDRRAARVRAARPRRRADRLGLAVHEDRARLRGVDRGRPAVRRPADVQRRPGARAARRSPPRSRPARTSAARSSPTRSPSRWRSAIPPTARTRSTSRAAPAARSTPSPTTRSARGSSCSRGPPGSSPRPPAASRSRCSPSSRSGATSIPASASSPTSPARA